MDPKPRKLLDQVRDCLRLKQYAHRTEETYILWIRQYILFHNKRHPVEMGRIEVEAFLTHLAVEKKVAASTQNQALSAILFLYRHILKIELTDIDAVRARQSRNLPTVLTPQEVRTIIAQMTGTHRLLIQLLYGTGMRMSEALSLRVKDLDFSQQQIIVRNGKGMKDRITMLPNSLIPDLQSHLQKAKTLHEQDLNQGYGSVWLPFALNRKYPNADKQWIWQWIFPSTRRIQNPDTKTWQHYHLHESGLQKALKQATRTAHLTNALAVTPSAIPSQPTFSKTATTSAPSKNSSVIKTSKPP